MKENNEKTRRKITPSEDPEEREKECIAAAYKLAQERIQKGTASSAEIVHFLKLGSPVAKLEKERLEKENELLKAKTEALQSDRSNNTDYGKVIEAIMGYRGNSFDADDD